MTPPVLLLETGTPVENVPAVVVYPRVGQAAVWHMDGTRAENYRLTVRRLLDRKLAVVPWPRDLMPQVRTIPPRENAHLEDHAA